MFLALGKLNGFQCLFIRPVGFEEGKLTTPIQYQPPRKARMVDALSAFANYPGDPAKLFYDTCHLTPEGHKLLAESIFKAITEYEMVGKKGTKNADTSRKQGLFQLKIEEPK